MSKPKTKRQYPKGAGDIRQALANRGATAIAVTYADADGNERTEEMSLKAFALKLHDALAEDRSFKDWIPLNDTSVPPWRGIWTWEDE